MITILPYLLSQIYNQKPMFHSKIQQQSIQGKENNRDIDCCILGLSMMSNVSGMMNHEVLTSEKSTLDR